MNDMQPEKSAGERDGRSQILNAAGTVFLAEGFERTSVDMIAAVARMSKQSIYELFPSKLALFEAAVRNTLDGARLNMVAIDRGAGVEATLTRYAHRLFEGFADSVNLGLFRANIAAARHFPELATELHEQRLAAAQPLAEYLDTLIASRAIRPCEPLALAIRFGGLAVEGSRYLLGRQLPGAAARKHIVAHAIGLFLDGYLGTSDLTTDKGDPEPITPPALEGTAALRLSDERLSALVDAAMQEFLEHGYRGASVDRIAARVRASKATVYRQFGNKEKLLRYVVQRDLFETSRSVIEPALIYDDLDTAIVALARQALDLHLAPSSIRMHRLLIEETELVSDLAQNFHDLRAQRLGDALCAVLLEYNQPLPSEAALRAFYVLATFAVRFITSAKLPDAAHRDIFARESALLFLYGIRNRRVR